MQALWMVLASLFFAGMSVCIKFAAAYFNTVELVAYRGAIGVVMMAAWCRVAGVGLVTRVPLMHLWRAVIGTTALTCWFYAIAHLPLATAVTLNYMSGVWVAAFIVGGTLAMGKLQDLPRQGPVAMTVLTGFAGVVMMLRPTLDQGTLFAGLVGLLSGLGAALAYMQVAALGRVGEPEPRIVFYFSIGATVVGLVGTALVGASPWVWPQGLWVIPVGLFAALGQLCVTRAYGRGATLVVANLQYTGIVFAAWFGIVLFGDVLPPIAWGGMLLIIASAIVATALRQRAVPSAPPEEL